MVSTERNYKLDEVVFKRARSLPLLPQDNRIELLFRALADPTRLRVIHLIGDGELCVRSFVEVLNVNQPKISRHLAYLRRAGLVSTRREGKWIYYRLVEPQDVHLARIFQHVRELLARKPDLQADKLRLEKQLASQAQLVEKMSLQRSANA